MKIPYLHLFLVMLAVSVANYGLGFRAGHRNAAHSAPPPGTNYVAVRLTNTTGGFLKLTRVSASNGTPEYFVSAAPQLAPTNNTPVATTTNSMASVEQAITEGMREAFASGVKLGAAAAWRGAGQPDIDAIQSFVHSNRLDLITTWFENHPKPTR